MLSFVLGGCRLEFHFSGFALLAFCCLFAGNAGGACFLAAVSIHEAAHLALLFLFRAPPMSAGFSALGCRLTLDPERPLGYGKSAAVSLAGPAANLLCVLIWFLWGRGESAFAAASLALGLFHSLPIEPMDGGLALRSLLSSPLGPERAEKLVFRLSLALLIPLAVLGFLVLLRSRNNFSLLAASVYLMLYLLLKHDLFTG